MKADRVVAGLHRLGKKSETQRRKCVRIVAGPSLDYEMECNMVYGIWYRKTPRVLMEMKEKESYKTSSANCPDNRKGPRLVSDSVLDGRTGVTKER